MFFEPDRNDHGLPYNPVKACVAPRPIGWITSLSPEGRVNLAPFSFFNMLSYNPPFVLFSSGGHAEDHREKDTVANVKATGEFVYNMATWDQREEMNQTGLIVDRGTDELAATGLEALPSTLVSPPRIKGSPVHFECRLHETVVLPGHDEASVHTVLFGRVVGVHIDDEAINEDGILDLRRVRPISRLGYKDYAVVDADAIFQMEKRTPEELIGRPRQAAE